MSTTTKTPETGSFAIEANEISKTYGCGEGAVHAFRDVSVGFETNRFAAIMGASGSSKSALMQCMAGLDCQAEYHAAPAALFHTGCNWRVEH